MTKLIQVWSPLSLIAVLSQLIIGAVGDTQKELYSGLSLEETFNLKTFHFESSKVFNNSKLNFSAANGIFVTKRANDTEEFEKNLKEALEDNDDSIFQIYGKQTKKNRIKEYENVVVKKDNNRFEYNNRTFKSPWPLFRDKTRLAQSNNLRSIIR